MPIYTITKKSGEKLEFYTGFSDDDARAVIREAGDQASAFAQELSRKRKLSDNQRLWLLYLAQVLKHPDSAVQRSEGPYRLLYGLNRFKKGEGGYKLATYGRRTYLKVRMEFWDRDFKGRPIGDPYYRFESLGWIDDMGWFVTDPELTARLAGKGRTNNARNWRQHEIELEPFQMALGAVDIFLDRLVSIRQQELDTGYE